MGSCCHWCAGRDHLGVDCPTRGTYTRPPVEPATVEQIVECAMNAARLRTLADIANDVRRMKTQAMDTLRSARAAKRWDRADEAQANANALQWVLDEIEKKAAGAAGVGGDDG